MQAMDMTYRQDISRAGRPWWPAPPRASARPSPTSWRRWAPGWWRWAWGRAMARWTPGAHAPGRRHAPARRGRGAGRLRPPRYPVQLRWHHQARPGARSDVFQQVLDVNLTGTMRVCAAARPALKAARGCIVNTASMLTFFGGGLLRRQQGRVGQLTVVGDRLRAGRHPRQRGGARLIATPLTQALQDDPARAGPFWRARRWRAGALPRMWRGRRCSCARQLPLS